MCVSDLINVEVVLATAPKQALIALRVPAGATAAEVIAASGVEAQFPDIALVELAVGVWGRLVKRDHVVREGDRVEIYRPLRIEPREARRQLARAGKTMGQAAGVAADAAKETD